MAVAQASGLYDYYSELNQPAWFDLEEVTPAWFDKDVEVAAAASSPARELVALQAVNRAGTF